ncbi:MAG: glycosyltransferase family 4 protein [Porphyromonadaceae bacterium]|nr:glycosyltransferase family 4 protein [Porphyromonadaceae bacterium]
MGIDCAAPRGGIAHVLYTYKKYIFETFRFIPTTHAGNRFSRKIYAATAYFKLFFHLLKRDVKIVHLHGASGKSFYRKRFYINLCHLFKVKIIYHIHSGHFKKFADTHLRTVQKTLCKCDTVVALSRTWETYFTSIGCKKVVTIPNPIAPPQFFPVKKEPGQLHLLFLGTITQQKGIYDLLHTIKRYKKELSNKVYLHIGGKGEERQLRQEMAELAMDDRVIYHGFVANEEKFRLFCLSDVLVLPSYIEGLPISILEAMSYGMPVIASRVGGIPDIVKDKETGYLITPGNTEELGEAILTLLNDPQKRAEMGKKAEESARNHFPQKVEKSLEALYDQYL